jgi:hypothetical protein
MKETELELLLQTLPKVSIKQIVVTSWLLEGQAFETVLDPGTIFMSGVDFDKIPKVSTDDVWGKLMGIPIYDVRAKENG